MSAKDKQRGRKVDGFLYYSLHCFEAGSLDKDTRMAIWHSVIGFQNYDA